MHKHTHKVAIMQGCIISVCSYRALTVAHSLVAVYNLVGVDVGTEVVCMPTTEWWGVVL